MTDHYLNKYAQTWRALNDAEDRAAREAYLNSDDHRLHIKAEREATHRLYAFLAGFLGGTALLIFIGAKAVIALFG